MASSCATGLADTLVADDVDAIRLIPELGITCAVEVLPGHVLTNLLASAVPSLAGISIENVAHVRTISDECIPVDDRRLQSLG